MHPETLTSTAYVKAKAPASTHVNTESVSNVLQKVIGNDKNKMNKEF
jgi:hypothetical protein